MRGRGRPACDGGWSDQVDAALREAENEDNGRGSGTYLLGTRALYDALQGDAVQAEELARHALSWARSSRARRRRAAHLGGGIGATGPPRRGAGALDEARTEDEQNPAAARCRGAPQRRS